MRELKGNKNWIVVEITDINTVVDRFKKVIEKSRFSFETHAKCTEEVLRNHESLAVNIDPYGDLHLLYDDDDRDIASLMGDNLFDGCIENIT